MLNRRSILVAICVVGVASGAAIGKPVTVELWHGLSTTYQPTLQALVDRFEAECPDIAVTVVRQGGSADTQAKLESAMSQGTLPTAALVYGNWASGLQTLLYPIGPHMSSSETLDIVDSLVPDNTYNGVLTTLPFSKSVFVLYYNADLVATPPATWAEYHDLAVSLTADFGQDGTVDRYGTAFRPEARPEYFLLFLDQAGGSILSDDWSSVTINDSSGQTAIQFLEKLAPYSLITNDYLNNHMSEVAVFIDSSASYGYVEAGASGAGYRLGVAVLPTGPMTSNTIVEGQNFAIFDVPGQSQDQKDAAVLLGRFLLRPENSGFWAMGTGCLPVVRSAFETQEWIDYVLSHPYQATASAQMLHSFSTPLHPEYSEMRSIISAKFGEVMRGLTNGVEGLDLMASEIENLLGL